MCWGMRMGWSSPHRAVTAGRAPRPNCAQGSQRLGGQVQAVQRHLLQLVLHQGVGVLEMEPTHKGPALQE